MIRTAVDPGCAVFDPGCWIGEGVTDLASGVAGDFVKTLAEGTMNVLVVVNSFWMNIPTPDVNSTAIQTIQTNLSWYTYAFAVLGIMLAVGKMLIAGDFKAGAPAVKMIFNLILTTAFYTTVIAAMLMAGDAFAPWIIEKATGAPMSVTGILNVAMFMAPGVGPGMLLVILAFLGALANAIFMLVRGVMIAILVAFLPVLAASSASESGDQAWKKAQGYLLAFLLFKPVAAVILALGLLMIATPPDFADLDEAGVSLFQAMTGIMTLIMVALALPTLIKFVVPVAAAGTSAAFSGGAVAAGAVAAGAAVVAIGATGGAAAAGAGAGAAKNAAPNVTSGADSSASTAAGSKTAAPEGSSGASSASDSSPSSGPSGASSSASASPSSSPSGSNSRPSDAGESSSASGPAGATPTSSDASSSPKRSGSPRTAAAADSIAAGARTVQQQMSSEDES